MAKEIEHKIYEALGVDPPGVADRGGAVRRMPSPSPARWPSLPR